MIGLESRDDFFDIRSLPQLSKEGATASAKSWEARNHNEDSDISEDDHNLTDMERDVRKVMRDSGEFERDVSSPNLFYWIPLSFVGTDDMVVAKSALEGNALCVEAAVDYLLQIKSSGR